MPQCPESRRRASRLERNFIAKGVAIGVSRADFTLMPVAAPNRETEAVHKQAIRKGVLITDDEPTCWQRVRENMRWYFDGQPLRLAGSTTGSR
jgi:hypothetical protein